MAEIFEKYLAWCEKNREARTYDWYRDHIQSFVDSLDKPAEMPVSSLKPFHVMEWADKHSTWSPAFRRGAIVAIQRPFNWAEKLGYIDRTPIKHIEKPQPQRREQIITPEEWVKIRDHYPEGDAFRDVLEFAWETGSRPFEVKRIEARHVQLDKHCVVFAPKEAKGKKRWRVIHMTPRAEEIIRRLLVNHPDGLLFLNAKGNPWNGFNSPGAWAKDSPPAPPIPPPTARPAAASPKLCSPAWSARRANGRRRTCRRPGVGRDAP